MSLLKSISRVNMFISKIFIPKIKETKKKGINVLGNLFVSVSIVLLNTIFLDISNIKNIVFSSL